MKQNEKEHKKHEMDVRVILADTDAFGIAYHANYIRWFEVGRTEYLHDIEDIHVEFEAGSIWLPVVETAAKYRLPAYYDDILVIRTWLEKVQAATLLFKYEVLKKETGELLATGSTKHATTDQNRKIVILKSSKPELYKKLRELQRGGSRPDRYRTQQLK